MAKKATSTGSSTKKKKTASGTGAAPKRKTAPKKKVQAKASSRSSGSGSSHKRSGSQGGTNASDVLTNLLESPLVADLLAVGATAALAALAEHRYGARSADERGAKRALKSAVTAAAAAMGKRLASEFNEVKESVKEAQSARAT